MPAYSILAVAVSCLVHLAGMESPKPRSSKPLWNICAIAICMKSGSSAHRQRHVTVDNFLAQVRKRREG